MIEVVATDEFVQWFETLDKKDSEWVESSVFLLEQAGVRLGYPYSSSIQGSRYPIRELRIQSGGRPLRVFYAFDPNREAVLILGGDKTGDNRFYERFIPEIEKIGSST